MILDHICSDLPHLCMAGTTIMAKLGTLYVPRSGSVVDSCAASKSTALFSCREVVGLGAVFCVRKGIGGLFLKFYNFAVKTVRPRI